MIDRITDLVQLARLAIITYKTIISPIKYKKNDVMFRTKPLIFYLLFFRFIYSKLSKKKYINYN